MMMEKKQSWSKHGHTYESDQSKGAILVKTYGSPWSNSSILKTPCEQSRQKASEIASFSAQELQQATNNYNKRYGMRWYKGSLEGRMVFVKRFPENESFAEFVINDIVISAQMSAHNQIFVYHITQQQNQPMVWERRLKIARQIAHAISYLHDAFSRPVIHMYIDIKNILLDEHDVPKLSNFYFSVSIPEGETDVEGFQNRHPMFRTPELEATGKVNEKTDVYKFGVVLLELLTGEDSDNIIRLANDEGSNLVAYMHNRDQVCCINEIVDPAILVGEGGASLEQQLQSVVDLALTCTEEDPERRPTMVDVTKELRRIESFVP
uniref:Protein kinase domain-containing protein n=1 Tax=Quercus lobata TaxID=97700 RepID=A0A7N2N0T9_QUELO